MSKQYTVVLSSADRSLKMMSDENKRMLEEKCPALMRSVDLQSSLLLALLVSEGTITTEQKEFILKDQGANFKQVETLVGILLKKGNKEVNSFIKCLEESGHSDVANELLSSCKEETSNTTCRAVCGRQEKTVCVKAEISAKSNSSSSSGDKREPDSFGTNPSVKSETRGNLAEGNRESFSPSRSEPDENSGGDTNEPHSSTTEEGNPLQESALLIAFQENILGILKTNVEGLKKGQLDKTKTLPILVGLSSMCREVIDVYQSSILFVVECPSLAALYDLKEAVASGSLRDSFIMTFFTPQRMTKFGMLAADIDMSLDEMEYNQCEQELITDVRKEMEQMEVKKDVDSPLDEMAQEEDVRRPSSTTKHDFRRLKEKSEFEDPEQLQIKKKMPKKAELAESGLGSTKASRDPDMQMLEYHERCIRRLDASKLEAETVIDRLQAVCLFTQPDVRDIMQLEDQEKAMRLLELIITAPDRAFDELVNALLETGQTYLARRLVYSECYALKSGVDRDDQFLTGEAFKLVETTAKHERGHTCRFIQPRLYQSHYLREYEVTRRAPYQAGFSRPELVEGETRRKDNVYEANHKRRGKALIFVHRGYRAHEDIAALIVPLQHLGFEVERYICDRTTMIMNLRIVAKEDHTDADCFLCVVLCVRLEADELLRPFESDNCPSLAGKPKIFIFQGIAPSPLPLEPDYLILQSSWFSPHHGFDELLTKAFNEMINKNGEEDFVHVCVEVMRARLEQISEAEMSEFLEYNYVATSFTKDLYLLPGQGSSSKMGTETHQKEEARYLQTDPLTSKKQQYVATSSTKGVYPLEQRMESGDVVKKVAGEEDT